MEQLSNLNENYRSDDNIHQHNFFEFGNCTAIIQMNILVFRIAAIFSGKGEL